MIYEKIWKIDACMAMYQNKNSYDIQYVLP